MTELVKNLKLMKKAQEEIKNYVENRRKVTEKDIEQLPYLKMIVKETLRLHPPAPLLIPREIISHFKIEGYDFYPKTMVQVNVWAIGRGPTYWKDLEEFLRRDLKRAQWITNDNTLSFCRSGLVREFAQG